MKKLGIFLAIIAIGYVVLFIIPVKKTFNPNMRCIQAPCGYEVHTLFEVIQQKLK